MTSLGEDLEDLEIYIYIVYRLISRKQLNRLGLFELYLINVDVFTSGDISCDVHGISLRLGRRFTLGCCKTSAT